MTTALRTTTPPRQPSPQPDTEAPETWPVDDVPVRGARLLLRIDRILGAIELWSTRFIPRECNPLLQAGAIANTALLIAIATGIALLVWYVPSVDQAYRSMQSMDAAPFGSGLVRSLHRYSSDACMLFVFLHAAKLFAARRFTKPRWLAWVTGLVTLFLLWLVGFLGYWLVWDQRAQLIAVDSARVLDVLPILTDPIERGFLTDEAVNSLLFFIVFFAHMLLPLGMGIALWLHLARLNKAAFLTSRRLTYWIVGTLVALSVICPATVEKPASMLETPSNVTMDFWYLLPVAIMERFGGGMVWLLFFLASLVALTCPWWMARRKVHVARVETSACNSCGQCERDCPYNAISMVPRTDGKNFATQSLVDPNRCVGCGICSGSCDTGGIGLHDSFPVDEQRKRLDAIVSVAPGETIRLVCTHTANPPTTDERSIEVPCAGWIHPYTIELLLRSGAQRVEVVACAPGQCRYRHGPDLIRERLAGERKPALRHDRVDSSRVEILGVAPRRANRLARYTVGALIVIALGVSVWAGSDLDYSPPQPESPELVVSFAHPGTPRYGRELTPTERARFPKALNRTHVLLRGLTPVRLRVAVDGVVMHDETYAGGGLWGDGNSFAIARIALTLGHRSIEVWIGDTIDPDEWTFHDRHEVEMVDGRRCVVLFDRVGGFVWSGDE